MDMLNCEWGFSFVHCIILLKTYQSFQPFHRTVISVVIVWSHMISDHVTPIGHPTSEIAGAALVPVELRAVHSYM